MSGGYVGQRSRRRGRYQILILFLIFLIGAIVFFANSSRDTYETIVEIEEPTSQKEDNISIRKLEIKLFETEQRVLLRENLVSSLKDQINSLEVNNNELIKAIQQLNIENEQINIENEQNNIVSQKLQKNNLAEIEQLQRTIDKLNKEININIDSFFSLKNENDKIQNLVGILENNNNTLELQKDIAFKKIEELKMEIIEKNKLIKEMEDKIHH